MTDADDDATALAEGVDAALPRWVVRSVERVLADAGRPFGDDLRRQATEAGERARVRVMPRLRALLAADIDAQRTNPLAVIRSAATEPTEVLRVAGVPPRARDEQSRTHFPDDDYDLVPASFADLDPALHEPGLMWGAAKAHVHLRRRRAEGQR